MPFRDLRTSKPASGRRVHSRMADRTNPASIRIVRRRDMRRSSMSARRRPILRPTSGASADRLVQLWKRWSASRQIAIRILSPRMDSKLLDELHGVWCEGALRIPGSDIPTPNRSAAMEQRYSMDLPARDPHAGRNHSNAITGRGQSDQCLGSGAFKEDARSDASDLASGIEPLARGKSAAQQ